MQKLLRLVLLTAAGWTLLVSSTASAQCTEGRDGCPQRVPRVMKFNGALRDANGTPRSGMVGILFGFTDRMGELPCGKRLKMCS